MAESSDLAVDTASTAGWLIHLSISLVPVHLPVSCRHSLDNSSGGVMGRARICSRGDIAPSFAVYVGTGGKGKQ